MKLHSMCLLQVLCRHPLAEQIGPPRTLHHVQCLSLSLLKAFAMPSEGFCTCVA
jgi:hypothetical protein